MSKSSASYESESGKTTKSTQSESQPDLADSVLAYLDLKDGPTGSEQDYQNALDTIVAALPESHVPQSLQQTPQPEESTDS